MGELEKDLNSQTEAVYPAVLQVSGEQARRWCTAVWSNGPGERRLVGELHRLIQGTLIAHWMQPPAQYELMAQPVNSFDVIFYEAAGEKLAGKLRTDGWQSVDLGLLPTEEYEQFEVLAEEAAKRGTAIDEGPAQLWRITFDRPGGGGAQGPTQLGADVAKRLGDQVWGQTPGWFSRVFCERLKEMTGVELSPNYEGLRRLEQTVFSQWGRGIRWLEPMAYQAICDFIGVAVQAESSAEVQWGSCPVDERTGLAPAPLLRIRHKKNAWKRIGVGYDVIEQFCVPWGERTKKEAGDTLDTLVRYYAPGG